MSPRALLVGLILWAVSYAVSWSFMAAAIARRYAVRGTAIHAKAGFITGVLRPLYRPAVVVSQGASVIDALTRQQWLWAALYVGAGFAIWNIGWPPDDEDDGWWGKQWTRAKARLVRPLLHPHPEAS